MIIISHRGYWKVDVEKNREAAFERSFSMGFGTETDVRERNGELVIAHDVPCGTDLSFDAFCQIYRNHPGDMLLALNIKADGLASRIKQQLTRHGIDNYFLFDMSVPELRVCLSSGLACYTRVSDIELEPCFYGASHGIWLDGFYSDWYRPSDLYRFLRDGKNVCLVSSELHKRDPLRLWSMLKEAEMHREPKLALCTDKPEHAHAYFFGADV